MAYSYTRQSSMSDGDTITAALFNDEYNQLVNAFTYHASTVGSTGHRHDGTAGHGGNIHTIGDLDFLNKIVADSTNNRWGVFVEVSSAAVEQIRISDGVISPVTDNDIDLGTSSLEFKDLFIDGTAHIDTLDVDVNGTVAGTFGVTGATTLSSTLAVTGAVTGSSTIQGTTITATTAFVPDASDGAALGTSALEFSDLFLADGAVINFGDDQDVSLTHVADTGLLLSSTDQLQFGDSGTYIYQSADGVLDLVSDTEIELTATTIDINGAVAMDGAITGGTNITISGELDAATLDISGNADIDGTLEADAYTVDGTALNEYIADTVGAMVGSNTETNITVTYEDGDNTLDFVIGTLNQDTSGTAALATSVTVSANNSTDETVYPIFVDGATGTQGAESDTGLTYNPSTGMLTSTGVTSTFTGNITGNVTGNTSGTAATVTTAAQTNITSLGTLTALTVDNLGINGNTITANSGALNLTPASGSAIVLDGTISVDAGVVTGATAITLSGELDAGSLDVSGDADIDGTLEADAITIGGVTLAETIADTVGAMVGSNTESGITVAYQDGDNTLDFTVGTLNQDTTGTAAIATTVTITDNESTDESNAIIFTAGGDVDGGNLGLESDGTLTYNPSSGLVTATSFAGQVTTAAQTNITSLGTLTALTVDDVAINGKVITMTGSSSDTAVLTAGTNGTLSIVTTDAAAAAANIQITADGTVDIDSAGVLTLDSGAAINIEPASGSAILLDGTISIDAGVVTGATSITSTAFVGDITGDVTGNVDTFTASANNSTNETVYPVFVDGATGAQGAETDTGLTYNPSTGLVSSVGVTASGTVTYGSLSDGSITITAFVDEDDMSSDSATLVPTQQSVKAYVDNNAGSMTSFQLEDDDGTEVAVSNAKEVKFIGSGITTNWTDTSTGSDGDPYDLTFTVDAAQTGITSLLATDIKIGEDDQTKIDFETADEIHFFAANVEQVYLGDNIFGPQSDSDVDLGSTGVRWKDAFVDSITVTGEVDGASLDISGDADIDGTLETDNLTVGGAQGSDGQVLTSTGSGVAWEDASGGGASAIDGLSDAVSGIANFTNSLILGHQTTGTLSSADGNTAVGYAAMDAITSGDNNVAVGYNSLSVLTTGGNNVAVGAHALAANTTGGKNVGLGYGALNANTTGQYNTAIGDMALSSNSTGTQNTAVGMNALSPNTTASNNTGIGYNTLAVNTTGADNTAMGAFALDANTTADNCTAVGKHALGANTTGIENVSVGNYTLDANTTGTNSTAVGYNALSAATSAVNNVAIGSQTLAATTSGPYNTAVGNNALTANTTGHSNVAVGAYAMDAITTGVEAVAIGAYALTAASGSSNVALGYKAGEDVTTGTNNIFLGKETGRSASPGGSITTGDNEVVIGNNNITEAHIKVDWTVSSDERDKTDFTALDVGLNFINDLVPLTYKWDQRSDYGSDYTQVPDGTHKQDKLDVGFTAQAVETLEEQYGYKISDKTNLTTSLSEDGNQYGLKYSKFVPILVKAIQELSAKVEDLEDKLK